MLATGIQRMSEAAYRAVRERSPAKDSPAWKKYRSFALAFPALIHASGLCQAAAVALADSGRGGDVLADVLETLNSTRPTAKRIAKAGELAEISRNAGALEYMQLARQALEAASLVKRYVEVLHHDN